MPTGHASLTGRSHAIRRSIGYCLWIVSDQLNRQKEWLSRAFVQAIAATAGYSVQFCMDDFFGVDAVVSDHGIVVDFQLKATASPMFEGDVLKFDLDVATYDKMRDTTRSGPGYLVVVALPMEPSNWLRQSGDELAMRHCGYWLPLIGMPPTSNSSTIRLRVPRDNKLTVEHLGDIMRSARARIAS